MKVFDLRGRLRPWKLSGCRVLGDETRPRSGLHKRARAVIRSAFPVDIVLEEVPIPGTRLRADFYVSTRSHMVEVHGEQHFKFIAHFHRDGAGFRESLKRDADKRAFCEANNIILTILRFDQTDEQWRDALLAG